ncbi:MAG TPA: RNA 2',3'-cyclic phosphodiesterase [Deltaproteobacteria bacterium]|nr:RNA 2',3'-cyclic phosphodiesterase [Deltaproteobacteria bacterium]
MIRTFIALPIPDDIKKALGDAICSLRSTNSSVRWVRPDNIHLTLKFLGGINEDLVDPISMELDKVAAHYGELNLTLSGLGVFPGIHRPRVVWAGLEGDTGPLVKMASSVDAMCVKFGINPDKRPCSPHITLGRLKTPSMVDLGIHLGSKNYRAKEVVFYRSELLPQGARYTILHTSNLGHKGG